MNNKIEYIYQKKQVERDVKYLKETYDFDEIEALKLMIEKYQLRIEAAGDLIISKGGKL